MIGNTTSQALQVKNEGNTELCRFYPKLIRVLNRPLE